MSRYSEEQKEQEELDSYNWELIVNNIYSGNINKLKIDLQNINDRHGSQYLTNIINLPICPESDLERFYPLTHYCLQFHCNNLEKLDLQTKFSRLLFDYGALDYQVDYKNRTFENYYAEIENFISNYYLSKTQDNLELPFRYEDDFLEGYFLKEEEKFEQPTPSHLFYKSVKITLATPATEKKFTPITPVKISEKSLNNLSQKTNIARNSAFYEESATNSENITAKDFPIKVTTGFGVNQVENRISNKEFHEGFAKKPIKNNIFTKKQPIIDTSLIVFPESNDDIDGQNQSLNQYFENQISQNSVFSKIDDKPNIKVSDPIAIPSRQKSSRFQNQQEL